MILDVPDKVLYFRGYAYYVPEGLDCLAVRIHQITGLFPQKAYGEVL